MAIDIKELRIGSHVNFNGTRVEIQSIDVCDDEYAPIIIKTQIASVDPDEIAPIPITPELLTELGFEYKDKIYWDNWFKGGFDIERDKDSKYFDYSSELRLEYLHELETLYYMIYGVELITD